MTGRPRMYVPGALTSGEMGHLGQRKKDALRRASKAQEMRRKGYSHREIMNELNISERTAARYCTIDLDASVKQMLEQDGEKEIGLSEVTPPGIKLKEDIDIIGFSEDKAHLNFKLNPMQALILKAFYGLEMTDEELAIMRKLQDEKKTTWEEGAKYRELVVVAGMKGGKTIMSSVIACYEEYEVYRVGDASKRWGFPKDEKIFIINVATSSTQAEDTIYAQTVNRIHNSPFYNLRRYSEKGDTVWFKDSGVRVRCGHSNSASIVGKLAKLVLFDELARFKFIGGKNSADAVYTSLTRSVEPFGEEGKIVSISSPLYDKDKIMSLFGLSGKIPNMLGFKLATWEMNPQLPKKHFKFEFDKDPESAARDFGADPSKGTEDYYRMPARIDDMFEKCKSYEDPVDEDGKFKEWFKGNPEFDYYMHGDPAARNDAFGIGLAHRLGKRFILDLCYRFETKIGEIDVLEVRNFMLEILRRGFAIKRVTFDTWGAVVVWQALQAKGLDPQNLYVLKGEHDELKNTIYQGTLEGHFPEIVKDEAKGLILKGGMKVDHRYGGSKDVIDAAAAVISGCAMEETMEVAAGGKEPDEEFGRRGGEMNRNVGIMGQRRGGFGSMTGRRIGHERRMEGNQPEDKGNGEEGKATVRGDETEGR